MIAPQEFTKTGVECGYFTMHDDVSVLLLHFAIHAYAKKIEAWKSAIAEKQFRFHQQAWKLKPGFVRFKPRGMRILSRWCYSDL